MRPNVHDRMEANIFAGEGTAGGDITVMAGTINPIAPKQVIPSAEIPDGLCDNRQPAIKNAHNPLIRFAKPPNQAPQYPA